MKSLRSLRGFNLSVNSLDNFMGLGELTNMRNLTLTGKMVRHTDVLCSSLRKLCSLEYLHIDTEGCMDGLSPPGSLQRLTIHFGWGCYFSRVPNWTRELHNLRVLQFEVVELLKDDVCIVAKLPSLTDLNLHVQRPPKEMIVIYGAGGFPVLKRFILGLTSASYLTFQAGAMPMLQWLWLNFSVKGWKQNEGGPAGIEHLPALQKVSVVMYNGTTESEKSSAESAFRSAVDRHPNNPPIVVRRSGSDLFLEN